MLCYNQVNKPASKENLQWLDCYLMTIQKCGWQRNIYEKKENCFFFRCSIACTCKSFMLNLTHIKLSNQTELIYSNKKKHFLRVHLCYILIDKQMLYKVFCSNIAPSLSSGNHLFYKAEYMGRSCPNQVWTITFDWSALATWNKHFQTAFW